MPRRRVRHPPDDRPVGEVLWFFVKQNRRLHAFEVFEGTVEPLSICGNVDLESADDEPEREIALQPRRRCCFYCGEVVLPLISKPRGSTELAGAGRG